MAQVTIITDGTRDIGEAISVELTQDGCYVATTDATNDGSRSYRS